MIVTAFNLVTLHDQMTKISAAHQREFHCSHDAAGSRIIWRPCAGYVVTRTGIYDAQIRCQSHQADRGGYFSRAKDFGVRTFGMPDNPGYLGVCFGSVITANSPASPGGKSRELGGRSLARVHPRHHADRLEEQNAALLVW